ncbi:MAG: DUF2914 domain-containing protein [Candidatus Pacebacteria bacterium]|nr:DUF2914 domain-containing protein [Candidatus Paceibacterota bacterium]MBP9866585.1 DUF2914 domain-containing protein [Candidatus Paceibacterota bacterium]
MKKLLSLHRYTAHTTTILFFVGFIFDIIFLPDITHAITRYIGALYLIVIAFLIMFREWVISRNTASTLEQKIYSYATFGAAYFSGSALSFIFVYALRSSSFVASWPLFVLFIVCIAANELVSTHGFRLALDVGVLLIAIVFYVIFNTPLLMQVQNDTIFFISIIISIAVSLIYLYFLQFTSESAKHEIAKLYALGVGVPMFICMLYFLNVIPAVPLSLKEKGIYHSIVKDVDGVFLALGEKDTRILNTYRTKIHHINDINSKVYFFSSIDTPAKLTAPVSHVWQYYDTVTDTWKDSTVISFDIYGGREEGYRAFSYKENITEGVWRVVVKIGENRIVGIQKFEVIRDNSVLLESSTL